MLVDFSYHPQIHDWVWIYFYLKEENAWDIILELTKVDFFDKIKRSTNNSSTNNFASRSVIKAGTLGIIR